MGIAKVRKRMPVSTMTDPAILIPAIGDAFRKLDPRQMVRNPVMFVVEIVATLTTILFLRDIVRRAAASRLLPSRSISGSGSRCCSPISPKPSPRAAARPRPHLCAKPRPTRMAKLLATKATRIGAIVPAASLKRGDMVLVEAGDLIPSDGDVIEGVASVDEAAITGESAPVIRESGGDRSAVTGGTTVHLGLDHGEDHGGTRLDIPRPHDRAGGRGVDARRRPTRSR